MQQDEAKIQEFFQRARKGVLKHLEEKGGILTVSDLHEFSLNKFLIQHQRFSMMMEGLVNEGLVIYEPGNNEFIITDQGKAFIK